MSFDNEELALLLSPKQPPLGTLEAIELSDHPEIHLKPARPEHQTELRSLFATELGALSLDARQTDPLLDPALSFLTDAGEDGSVRFSVFEGRRHERGSLIGSIALQSLGTKRPSEATLGVFISQAHRSKDEWRAIQAVLAYGQEYLDLHTVVSRKTLRPYVSNYDDLKRLAEMDSMMRIDEDLYSLHSTVKSRMDSLKGSQSFYTSPYGTLVSEIYERPATYTALEEDILACSKQVTLGGLLTIDESCLTLLSATSEMTSRDVSVQVRIPFWDETTPDIARQLEAAGAQVLRDPFYRRTAILDRRIFWESISAFSSFSFTRLLGYERRTKAERPIPIPVIQPRRVV